MGTKDIISKKHGPRGRMWPTTFAEHARGRALAGDDTRRGQAGHPPGRHGVSEEPGRRTVPSPAPQASLQQAPRAAAGPAPGSHWTGPGGSQPG